MKNKNKILFSFLILMLIAPFTMAQSNKRTNANVSGYVKCKGENVPYVPVYIDGTTIGSLTDGSGYFIIKHMPEGDFTICAGGVGYKTVKKYIKTVANKTIDVTLEVEEDVLNLDAALITGDRNKINRKESSVVVTSVPTKVFKRTQSLNVAEGINFTPGLRSETNCQNCGFTQVRMNGMEGAYSQILINSNPVFSGLAGVYGLELIPANMIERLEVVRGGGSSLFGGNAIAGTINIITKEPVTNSIVADFRGGIIGLSKDGGKPAMDGIVNINTSLISDNGKTGGYLYGSFRNRNPYDANGDGFSEMVKMENTTFGFNVFHKPGINNKITLDGYRISEFRRGGNNFMLLPHQADITEQLRHTITAGTITYDQFVNHNHDKFSIYASAQHVKRDSYYGAQQDPNAYGFTTNLTSTVGGHYIFNLKRFLFAPSTTTIGLSNVNDYLVDNKLGGEGQGNTLLIDQYVNTTGAFLKHDWKTNLFNISLGVRYDYYMIKDRQATDAKQLSKGVFVPRASILYKALDNLRFRVGYAKGYRAPQVFNEDLHIELVNATRVKTINSDSLVQENSHSVTASVDFDFNLGQTANDLLVEGFYTMLQNPFASVFTEIEDKPGEFVYVRQNAEDGAYVAGANIEFNSYVSSFFNYQIGFTLQQSRFITPQPWGDDENNTTKNFIRTPNRYGYAVFSFTPVSGFNIDLSMNYTGPMYVPHFGLNVEDFEDDPEEQANVSQAIQNGDIIAGEALVKSKDLFVANLLLSYDFNITRETTLQIYCGVKNIFNQTQKDFDRGVYRDAGYLYGPMNFRSINFGIKLGRLN